MKIQHTMTDEAFARECQSQNFADSCLRAQLLANKMARQMRVYRSYGSIAVSDAKINYYGNHLTFINPEERA